MTFGVDFDKLLVIGLIAVLIVGPERLPKLAEQFARFVRRAAEYLRGARERVSQEIGPEFSDADWRKLDPRQYDPRRIIRDALLEPAPAATARAVSTTAVQDRADTAATGSSSRLLPGELPPFDDEAT